MLCQSSVTSHSSYTKRKKQLRQPAADDPPATLTGYNSYYPDVADRGYVILFHHMQVPQF
jgi:hypothetical protein